MSLTTNRNQIDLDLFDTITKFNDKSFCICCYFFKSFLFYILKQSLFAIYYNFLFYLKKLYKHI